MIFIESIARNGTRASLSGHVDGRGIQATPDGNVLAVASGIRGSRPRVDGFLRLLFLAHAFIISCLGPRGMAVTSATRAFNATATRSNHLNARVCVCVGGVGGRSSSAICVWGSLSRVVSSRALQSSMGSGCFRAHTRLVSELESTQ